MFDAIFIDADNTLFDFDRTQEKALAESLVHFSLPQNDDVLSIYETINRECWTDYHAGLIRNDEINLRRWSQWLTAIGEHSRVAAQALADHYAQSLALQCELEDGADDLMQYLAAKLPVHVITNGFPSSQQHRWRKAGWDGLLHGITVSAAVGVQKPEADIFHIAMAAVGVTDPGRCLMIGDTLEADVRGPQNVGMKGCWYQRKGAENNTDIQPDYVVTQLSDIKGLV